MKQFPFISLKIKMAVVLAVMVSILIVTSGFLAISHSYRALRAQKQQDELVMAKNTAIQVEEVLSKARKAVEALARMPSIQSMNADRQVDALTIVTQTTELIDGIVITDPSGKIIAIDAEINTERVMPKDKSKASYRLFAKGVSSAQSSVISEAYLSKTDEVCVAINSPIYRDGAYVGMVSGGILLKNHSMGGIDNIRIGNTGYAYIVDSSGDVIMHPQKEKILEDFSANPAVKELLSTRKAGVTEFQNQEGINILAAFAPIEETGWGVVVRQPTTESYDYAEHIRTTLWILLGIGVVLSLLVGFLLAHRILKPVSSLAMAVRKVSAGEFNASIEATSHDEIGELAKGFNEMTGHLRKHLADIDAAHKKILETQAHLAQSEKLATVGQLAAGLAHEINNPINIILGFSELLLNKLGPDHPQRNYVDEINREVNRCQKLVRNLLNFSRPTEIKKTQCDLNQLADETIFLLDDQSKQHGVEITFSKDTHLPAVQGDADQLKQVILNVLLNAIQAMPEGGRVQVSTAALAENGHVRFEVKDTGPGIPAGDQEKIFSPFFTTKEQGTGLGLAVSYAIIEQHGGKIEVSNASEGGAVFTILLPKEGEELLG